MNNQVLSSTHNARTERAQQTNGELEKLARQTGIFASICRWWRKVITRHLQRDKLLPRHRIELLLDEGAPFLELCALAGHRVGGGIKTGASIIGGIGTVSGVECLIVATESTIKGGAMNEYSVQKSRRLAEIAAANGLPTINLVESAGADLPNQSKIFVPGGQGFRDLTRASKQRRPTICVVFGSSTRVVLTSQG